MPSISGTAFTSRIHTRLGIGFALLILPVGLGTMGFGLPAAMGAKVAHPDKQVIDILRLWRPTPLFRARRLEAALDTPARVQEFLNTQIYYNNDHASPDLEELYMRYVSGSGDGGGAR